MAVNTDILEVGRVLTDLLEFIRELYETIDEGKLKGVTYPDIR